MSKGSEPFTKSSCTSSKRSCQTSRGSITKQKNGLEATGQAQVLRVAFRAAHGLQVQVDGHRLGALVAPQKGQRQASAAGATVQQPRSS